MLFSLNCICFLWTPQSLHVYFCIIFYFFLSGFIIFDIILLLFSPIAKRKWRVWRRGGARAAARGLASSRRISISASRSGSKLSFGSFTPVFPAADRQIRPRQRKRVTNLPLITILVDTFVLINPDRVDCARSSGQVLQRSQWASEQVETKESGQKTTFRWWCVMEAGLFTHKLALRVKTRDPRLGLSR